MLYFHAWDVNEKIFFKLILLLLFALDNRIMGIDQKHDYHKVCKKVEIVKFEVLNVVQCF